MSDIYVPPYNASSRYVWAITYPQSLALKAVGLPGVTPLLRDPQLSAVDVEKELQYLVAWRIHSFCVGRVI